jgi:putative mRNA 3-end processing factor
MALLEFTNSGIYCPKGGFYIDPWRKVSKALITHGHADHARWGMGSYLATDEAKPVMQHRLGEAADIASVAYGEKLQINGVTVSFHPAGHVVGSAQIRVEHRGEVWVVSGDYKCEDDHISTPFEPVQCHTFITESTFGLPVYRWQPQALVMQEINAWWAANKAKGVTSVLYCYALGKAQRILSNIDASIGNIYCHGAIGVINEILRQQGIALPSTQTVEKDAIRTALTGSLVLAPPSAAGTSWMRRFAPFETASASGWMNLRGMRRRGALDRGFVLSDHADWPGLLSAVEATGAEKVFVTHGYSEQFSRWLNESGRDAAIVQTQFEGEPVSSDDEAEKEEGT